MVSVEVKGGAVKRNSCFPGGSVVKSLQCSKHGRSGFDPWVWKFPRKHETHFSILAWRIPWAGQLGGLQSTGHKESDMTESTEHARMHKEEFLLFHPEWYQWRPKGKIQPPPTQRYQGPSPLPSPCCPCHQQKPSRFLPYLATSHKAAILTSLKQLTQV